MNSMIVLDPLGERLTGFIAPARRAALAAGDPIGILCNGKPNSASLLASLAEMLCERYGLTKAMMFDKQLGADGAGRPSPTAWINELAGRCKAVLVASGD